MRRVALVLGFLGVACAARFGPIYDDGVAGPNEKPLAELFDVWVAKHGKSYMDSNALGAKEEYTKRLGIFTTNWHFVAKLAEMKMNETWVLSFDGPLMDLHTHEFEKMLGYVRPETSPNALTEPTGFKYADAEIAGAIDWREKGAVTEVKDQGQCGSCWAFSTTGSVEGVNFLHTGKLVSLSEQDLVSCDPKDKGCNGGIMEDAYTFIKSIGGVVTEEEYPYTSKGGDNSQGCDTAKENAAERVNVSGYEDVPVGSEAALQKAISNQPVSVAVAANLWQFYGGGVFNGLRGFCGKQVNHGVLAVGMNTKDANPFYIVKNSWGAQWGEKGYIRLALNKAPTSGGQCEIASHASYPLQ
mmetsp:Transcript_9359/g.16081  ORF Transcript_9359/g.16081 Transcript_9359/m.16081 type:complete len:356 (+) Transcript_9359:105-1172(+)|eukprot:CAMPEP_0198229126 /NCGR_PEP_ID=MMETSP1445-20131203/113957_1 /TAXON_ID=36898 /ORGANISM="Pyramimonas sp., Strain CCMP2087" /LENGTH=355 /DNA_ID=CAMNT_0043909569 /DNA_START=495 /DNA_END=1562 /DNA_ORIENTATION=-